MLGKSSQKVKYFLGVIELIILATTVSTLSFNDDNSHSTYFTISYKSREGLKQNSLLQLSIGDSILWFPIGSPKLFYNHYNCENEVKIRSNNNIVDQRLFLTIEARSFVKYLTLYTKSCGWFSENVLFLVEDTTKEIFFEFKSLTTPEEIILFRSTLVFECII